MQSNPKHIGKTINQGKPTNVMGIPTSNNKTNTPESIKENTKTKQENVTESKDNTIRKKRLAMILKQNAKTCLYFRR